MVLAVAGSGDSNHIGPPQKRAPKLSAIADLAKRAEIRSNTLLLERKH
jgi:hypothetical protein